MSDEKALVIKTHKIRLHPTPEQEAYFWRCAYVAWRTFNWGLERWNELYESGERKISVYALKKEFNSIKAEQLPFVSEVGSFVYQGAFDDLGRAFSNYFRRHKDGSIKRGKKPRKDGKPTGYPRFKSWHRTSPAFYQANICLQFDGHWLKIPKVKEPINMAEPLRFEGKVMSGRFSYRGGHWWIAVPVEMEVPGAGYSAAEAKAGIAVGLDVGIKHLGVTSDGVVYDNPKALEAQLRKLRRLQRKISRQQKDSANWKKTKQAIAKLHYKVVCLRREHIHRMTTDLARDYEAVLVEDLNVSGMLQNRRLARSIAEASFGEIHRQLEYKAPWYGAELGKVGRFYPSSKTCNHCGAHNAELELSDRRWRCPGCGEMVDRDFNAAQNIRDEGLRLLAGRSALYPVQMSAK